MISSSVGENSDPIIEIVIKKIIKIKYQFKIINSFVFVFVLVLIRISRTINNKYCSASEIKRK